MLDTNAVLLFLTNDDPKRAGKVISLLNKEDCLITIEVIAEAVFNLEKKYQQTRQAIADDIKELITLQENLVEEENVVRFGCNVFASTKLDFVDCLLDGYAKVNGNQVFTFDDDLKKKLEHLAYSA